MLESRQRAGLQLISILSRHYLNMARVEGSDAHSKEEAATLLGVNAFPAGKALQQGQRLGAERLATAVRWLTEADLALKGRRQLRRAGLRERPRRHRVDGDRDSRRATGATVLQRAAALEVEPLGAIGSGRIRRVRCRHAKVETEPNGVERESLEDRVDSPAEAVTERYE
jgi:hypothetical protein